MEGRCAGEGGECCEGFVKCRLLPVVYVVNDYSILAVRLVWKWGG